MADAPKVKAVPKGFRTATPALIIDGCGKALEFYKKAFNAKEIMRMPTPDGKVGHAEIKIGNSIIMMSDEWPDMGARSPKSIGGSGSSLYLYVRNCDRVFKRAVKAGATSTMEPADMFWGDRMAKVTDPFGHVWGISTHKEDLTPEQVAERGAKWMAEMAADKQG